MINGIIRRLIHLGASIEIYGTKTSRDFLYWGRNSIIIGHIGSYPEVIIHFPLSPINVQSYSLMTYKNDIFPTRWSLSGSHDNKTWTILSEVNEYLCSNYSLVNITEMKYFCDEREIKHYSVNNSNQSYFFFVKYSLHENSFMNRTNSDWFYSLFTSGFDLNGYYLIPFNQITKSTHYTYFSVFLFVIYQTSS